MRCLRVRLVTGSREVPEIGRPDITTLPLGGVDQAACDALLWSEAWNALRNYVKAAVSAGGSGTHRKMRVCALAKVQKGLPAADLGAPTPHWGTEKEDGLPGTQPSPGLRYLWRALFWK